MSKTLFTASTIWKGPEDNEPFVYFAGITQNLIEDLILEDSGDLEYAAGTAFKLIGNSKNNLGRLYRPYSKDNLVISNIPENVEYKIDDEKNLVIFPQNFPLTNDDISTIKCKYYENYASIFKSNLVTFEKVIDFKYLREKAITSMLASEDGIFIACVCGSLWFYDGNVIKGPIFKMEDGIELPATSLLKHKFYHEDEDYIYIASDKKQRLYRSKISTAKDGIDWEKVYGLGELNLDEGGILSMTSAFNKIFLGCRNNKVLIYSKSKEISLVESNDFLQDSLVESINYVETLETQELKSSNLNDFEPIVSDIKCIENARNEVFVGLSNKSEIWAYQEVMLNNPEIFENWVHFSFDEVFKNDPAPAQYYNYNSNTFSRNDINLGIARFYDSSERDYVKEALILKGNTLSSTGNTVAGQRLFEFAEGSDWEQLCRLNLPSQDFIEIDCASVSELTTLSNITIIDGYELSNYDLVILKDQSSNNIHGITNGIYQYFDGYLNSYDDFLIYENSDLLGFYIKNGNVNKNSRYFCTVDNFQSSNLTFTKSKYTFEIETKNMLYSSATGATNFKYSGVLNSLVNNEERILSSSGFTGYQGFEIADYYGSFKIQYNHSNIKLQSGSNVIEKTLPVYGSYKNWTFSTGSSLAATTDNWKVVNFVDSMIGSTESVVDQFSNSYTRYFLRIDTALKGNPTIQIDNLNLDVDSEASLKMRVRIVPQSSYGFDNAKINLYWSTENNYFPQKVSTPIQTSNDFIDYELKPIWKNDINSVRIEFSDLPENSYRPTYIDIDYIKIENENILFDLNNSFSKIRVTVEDRDIKVWLGKQYYPFINSKNFLTTDNYNKKYLNINTLENNYNKPYIKFGKIDNTAGNSLFAYSNMSFYMGEVYEPIKINKINFYNSQKLSSTGGVRFFSYHDGTIYCATDGFDSNNVNVNPDDRQSKIFSFNVNNKSWERSDITFDRKQIFNDDGTYNLLGIVRPLTLTSYKDLLYLSGQYANIKVV